MQSNQQDSSEISRWLHQLFAPVYFEEGKRKRRRKTDIKVASLMHEKRGRDLSNNAASKKIIILEKKIIVSFC